MSAARRFLPSDPKDFLRSIVPLALLAVGAILPDSPFIVLALIVLGTVVAAMRDAPVRWAWAGAIPVAVLLVIGPGVVLDWAGRACLDLTRELDDRELIRAVTVILVVLGVAIPLKANAASLWLRWPARTFRIWIPVAFVGALAAGLVVGFLLGTSIPGGDRTLRLDPAALVPALVFGVTRSIVDELAFRGALLGWTARVLGTGPAIVGQAVIYALAFPGPGWHAGGRGPGRRRGRRGRRHHGPHAVPGHPARRERRAEHRHLPRAGLHRVTRGFAGISM